MHIDLNHPNEAQFENGIRSILIESMIGEGVALDKVKIKGTKNQIAKFALVLAAEKKHLDAMEQQGEESLMATKTKAELEAKIDDLERVLEAKWPLV
tara:strand:- start:172 stop:462 length:291 start_codon:yes stop_codon:yes gene_type:complete